MGVNLTLEKKISIKSTDVDIIKFIIYNEKITIEEICRCFDISQVNARTILQRIDSFVSENNLGTLMKEGIQYYFKDGTISFDAKFGDFNLKDLEKKERIVFIALKLIFEKSINLTSISRELEISRITLNTDLELIRERLSAFDLFLESIQWRGVFIKGDEAKLQKFSILFIAKLYIEEYFNCPFKMAINPVLNDYFRKYVPEEIEKRFIEICNNIYFNFGIQLGTYNYSIMLATLIFMYINSKKNMEYFIDNQISSLDLNETLSDLLSDEDKKLLGSNLQPLISIISNNINKRSSLDISIFIEKRTEDIISEFKISNKEQERTMNFLINIIFFENALFIPNFLTYDKKGHFKLETDTCKKITSILENNKIPFSSRDVLFLASYYESVIKEFNKNNILIIDDSSLFWKGKILQKTLVSSQEFGKVEIVSYFSFKYLKTEYPEYNIYIFIDLPKERNEDYPDKKCFFLSSYKITKNEVDLKKLLLK